MINFKSWGGGTFFLLTFERREATVHGGYGLVLTNSDLPYFSTPSFKTK